MKGLKETKPGSELKTVGRSGQISLGKSYAGRTLRLDRLADGRMMLTAVAIIPESQVWTLKEPDRSRIERGLSWAAKNPPSETNLDQLTAATIKARPKRQRARRG